MIQTVVSFSSQVLIVVMFLAALTLMCLAFISPVVLCGLVHYWY